MQVFCWFHHKSFNLEIAKQKVQHTCEYTAHLRKIKTQSRIFKGAQYISYILSFAEQQDPKEKL